MFKKFDRLLNAVEEVVKLFKQHHNDVEHQLTLLVKQTSKKKKKKK